MRKILLLILLLFCFGYPNIALSDTCPEGTTPSYTCPDEFTLNQSTNICEANPRCTTGSYSSSLHKCVEQPTILENGEKTCPSGTNYDMINDVCFISATCPSGGTLNTTSNKCELEPTLTCQQAPSPPLSGYYCFVDLNDNGAIEGDEYQQCLLLEDESYFCPLGSVECIDTYGEPICPSGSTLNPDTDKCEATPSISCSSGYTYNSDVDKCVMSISCPNGGSLNSNTDLCEIVVTSDLCPGGYTYNSGLDACTKTAVCPANGVYNSISDKCELPPDHSCSSGYTYNSSRDICEVSPTCSQGTYNTSTNRCEQSASAVCPSGYTYNSSVGKCVTAASCPNGGSLNTSRDKCETVYSHSCPSGYSYNSSLNLCQGTPICSSGTYNTSTNRCEQSASAVCPSGYTYNSSLGICVTGATCSNGGSLNTSRDKCEVAYTPACASGYTYNSSRDKCEANPVCPSGSSYNTTYNVCLKAVSSITCPSGYSYNSSRQKCEANPTCPSGSSYNASTDRCEKSVTTTCPSGYSYNGSKCVASLIGTSGTSGGCFGDESTHCFYIQVSNNQIRLGAHLDRWSSTYWGSWIPLPYCPSGGSYNSSTGQCETSPSFSCPSGFTNVGGLCIVNPTCPSGGTLNTSVDKCQYTPTYNCDSGYTYDAAIGYCKINATCNSSGTLNTSVDKCQLPYSHSCPSGYSYNSSYGVCQKSPSCPTGGSYNTSRNQCEVDNSWNCPSGTTLSGSICYMSATCLYGGLNGSTDKCETAYTPTCPSGYSYNSSYGVCQKSPTCPSGSSYDNSLNQCARANTWNCPSGMNLSGSICYMSAACPTGGSLNTSTDLCEAESILTCFTDGYTYSSASNKCVSNPVCNYGYYDGSIDLCRLSASEVCPSGYTYNNDQNKCLLTPPCPSGALYSTTLNQCTIDATHDCPGDTLYSSLTRLCEAYPICEIGAYDPDHDGCYEGENTCPLGDYPCVNIDGVMKCSKNNCIDTGIGGSSNIEETSVDNTSYRDDGPRDADGVCLGQIYIFNGKGYQCRTSGVDTIFKNCCSSGIATKHQGKILLIIPQCNMSDAETDIRKDAGVCHYVGKFCSKKLKLLGGSICLQHKKSYCCFHSKLGRIIQEQGRPQLKTFGYSGDWGDPESPNCRGFTPEEFQMIDFDKIDLGEYFGDIAEQIQGKAAQIQQTEQQKISDFYQQTTGGN